MWFVTSLLTVVGAAYFYEKSEKYSAEVAMLCVAIAVPGTVLTLIAAPWPIQLLLLLAVLFSYRFTKNNSLLS